MADYAKLPAKPIAYRVTGAHPRPERQPRKGNDVSKTPYASSERGLAYTKNFQSSSTKAASDRHAREASDSSVLRGVEEGSSAESLWAVWDHADSSWDDAFESGTLAYDKLRSTDDYRSLGLAALICGRLEAYRHNLPEAEAFLSEAFGRFVWASDSYGIVVTEAHMAIVQIARGNVEQALRFSATPWASTVSLTSSDAELLHNIAAQAHWAAADINGALLHLAQAYKLSANISARRRATVTANLSVALFDTGDYESALSLSREAWAFQQQSASSPSRSSCLFNIIACLIRLERLHDAKPYLEDASAFLTDCDGLGSLALHNLCEAFCRLGRYDDARRCIQKQRASHSKGSSWLDDRWLELSEALLTEAVGDPDGALRFCRDRVHDTRLPWTYRTTVGCMLARLAERRQSSAEVAKWNRFVAELTKENRLHAIVAKNFRQPASPAPTTPLTEQELACLALSARGQTSTDIALKMGIKPRTVNFHFSNVLKKLHATNRHEAIAKAISANLIANA